MKHILIESIPFYHPGIRKMSFLVSPDKEQFVSFNSRNSKTRLDLYPPIVATSILLTNDISDPTPIAY